jgi:hypothetical protein
VGGVSDVMKERNEYEEEPTKKNENGAFCMQINHKLETQDEEEEGGAGRGGGFVDEVMNMQAETVIAWCQSQGQQYELFFSKHK